jgi:hypothetical protein
MNPILLSLGEGWKRNSSTDSKMSVAWLSHELYCQQRFACLPSVCLGICQKVSRGSEKGGEEEEFNM